MIGYLVLVIMAVAFLMFFAFIELPVIFANKNRLKGVK